MARLFLTAIVALMLAPASAFAQDRPVLAQGGPALAQHRPALAQIDRAGGEAGLGGRAFGGGRWGAAWRALREPARQYPDDPIVLRYLGLTYLRLDRPAEAAAVLARAKGDST